MMKLNCLISAVFPVLELNNLLGKMENEQLKKIGIIFKQDFSKIYIYIYIYPHTRQWTDAYKECQPMSEFQQSE